MCHGFSDSLSINLLLFLFRLFLLLIHVLCRIKHWHSHQSSLINTKITQLNNCQWVKRHCIKRKTNTISIVKLKNRRLHSIQTLKSTSFKTHQALSISRCTLSKNHHRWVLAFDLSLVLTHCNGVTRCLSLSCCSSPW